MPLDPALRFERICKAQITAGNIAWVTAQRDAALAKITAGGGELVVINSGTANGKTGAGEIRLDALDVADIANSALEEAAGNGSGATGITIPAFGAPTPSDYIYPFFYP